MSLLELPRVSHSDRTADPMDWGLKLAGRSERQTPIAATISLPDESLFDGEPLLYLSSPHSENESIPATESDSAYPTDAVEAVEFIKNSLGVTQLLVLKAAKIPERTFEGWKQERRRPRTSSQRHLWPLVDAVRSLNGAHANLGAWVASDRQAQMCLELGDLNGFLIAESIWAAKTKPLSLISLPGDEVDSK